jgi:hypothetical protein
VDATSLKHDLRFVLEASPAAMLDYGHFPLAALWLSPAAEPEPAVAIGKLRRAYGFADAATVAADVTRRD